MGDYCWGVGRGFSSASLMDRDSAKYGLLSYLDTVETVWYNKRLAESKASVAQFGRATDL